MMQAKAWLLDIGMEYRAAVGGREVMHLLDVPVTYSVPYTPKYCNKVVSWQGRLLPVMNIAARLGLGWKDMQYVAVVGYQKTRGGEAQYGAIPLAAPPRQVMVSDDLACEMPEELQEIHGLAISCFQHEGKPVPVLNLAGIFSNQSI